MNHAYHLTNLKFSYGHKEILNIESLSIKSNKITALFGANGSGKSTLLNILAFLITPTQGQLNFLGNPAFTKKNPHYRKQIAFLTQRPYLLHGTVKQNISTALKIRHIPTPLHAERIATSLSHLGIANLAERTVDELSDGEKQKSALARALALDPDILILDEPFSYLDQTSKNTLESFIKHYHKTLIFSTHNRLQGYALTGEVITLVAGKPVRSSLVNLFSGQLSNNTFNTSQLTITPPDQTTAGTHISIDPSQIVLSKSPLSSSMRNHFQGRITAITEELNNILVTVNAGETFHIVITHQASSDLKLNMGDKIWLNFKSNAVTIF